MGKQRRLSSATVVLRNHDYNDMNECYSEITKIEFEAVLAEYNVLRGEIDVYHHHQNEIINFLIAIVAGVIGIIGIQAPNAKSTNNLNIVLLFVPIICMILSCLYTDKTIRIIRIADYLYNHVRPNINRITKSSSFEWEIYKRKTTIFNKRLMSILDKIRWSAFLVPSLLAIFLFFYQTQYPYNAIEITLVSVAGICTLVTFIIMFVVEETKGIKDRPTSLDD